MPSRMVWALMGPLCHSKALPNELLEVVFPVAPAPAAAAPPTTPVTPPAGQHVVGGLGPYIYLLRDYIGPSIYIYIYTL